MNPPIIFFMTPYLQTVLPDVLSPERWEGVQRCLQLLRSMNFTYVEDTLSQILLACESMGSLTTSANEVVEEVLWKGLHTACLVHGVVVSTSASIREATAILEAILRIPLQESTKVLQVAIDRLEMDEVPNHEMVFAELCEMVSGIEIESVLSHVSHVSPALFLRIQSLIPDAVAEPISKIHAERGARWIETMGWDNLLGWSFRYGLRPGMRFSQYQKLFNDYWRGNTVLESAMNILSILAISSESSDPLTLFRENVLSLGFGESEVPALERAFSTHLSIWEQHNDPRRLS